MTRPVKYFNADTLFANCTPSNDCYLWPTFATDSPQALLAPRSPMAIKFGSTSVIRILFAICRFPPAGRRLVRMCPNAFCVNPYHHTEPKAIRAKRAKQADPLGRLEPEKLYYHQTLPPDEELKAMRVKNPDLMQHLAETASRAGLTGDNLVPGYTNRKPPPKYADPNKPLLVIRRREEPPKKASTFVDPITPEMETEKEGFLGPYFDMLMAKKQAKEQERLIAQGYPDPIDGRDDH